MAKLASILKTDVMGDLNALAQLLQSKGRGKDTILAHITPAEAKRLKAAGGRGSRNPDTGLLEFDTPDVSAEPAPAPTPEVTTTAAPISSAAPDVSAAPVSAAPDVSAASPYSLTNAPAFQAEYGPTSLSQPLTPDLGTPISGPLSQQGLGDLGQSLYTPEQQAAFQQETAKPTLSTTQKIEKALGGPQGLARLGIAGLGGLAGIMQSRKAATQAEQAQAQEQALATPYQEQGRALTGAAARGELSPASLQAYQAAQARMQQQSAATGGVGVEQQAAQLEAFRQQLLANQYDLGLKVSSIGDQIALGAIRSGMTADQQLASANQNFYTALASIATGLPTSGYRPTG